VDRSELAELFARLGIFEISVDVDFLVEPVESLGNEEQTQHHEIKAEKGKKNAMKNQTHHTAGGIGYAQTPAGTLPVRSRPSDAIPVELSRNDNDGDGEEYLEVKHYGPHGAGLLNGYNMHTILDKCQ
jgi:hypothetical protein